MFVLLSESRDRALIQQWAVWLTKRDSIRALKVSNCRILGLPFQDSETHLIERQLLTSSASGKRKADEERALLRDIQNASTSAGAQYLEYLVLQKRILVRTSLSASFS